MRIVLLKRRLRQHSYYSFSHVERANIYCIAPFPYRGTLAPVRGGFLDGTCNCPAPGGTEFAARIFASRTHANAHCRTAGAGRCSLGRADRTSRYPRTAPSAEHACTDACAISHADGKRACAHADAHASGNAPALDGDANADVGFNAGPRTTACDHFDRADLAIRGNAPRSGAHSVPAHDHFASGASIAGAGGKLRPSRR